MIEAASHPQLRASGDPSGRSCASHRTLAKHRTTAFRTIVSKYTFDALGSAPAVSRVPGSPRLLAASPSDASSASLASIGSNLRAQGRHGSITSFQIAPFVHADSVREASLLKVRERCCGYKKQRRDLRCRAINRHTKAAGSTRPDGRMRSRGVVLPSVIR